MSANFAFGNKGARGSRCDMDNAKPRGARRTKGGGGARGPQLSGYRVFHDLRRDRFNVDHVVVGASGVYAIETKFRSGYGTINFRNGEGLFVNDQPWQGDRDPVAQARGSAAEIHKLIKDNCEVNVTVTALVVFVGEWKVKEKWQTTDARVVSESQLLRYFARQDQPELTRNEIRLIASHLERSAKA